LGNVCACVWLLGERVCISNGRAMIEVDRFANPIAKQSVRVVVMAAVGGGGSGSAVVVMVVAVGGGRWRWQWQ
jgi:hypothetical protein